MFKCVLQGFAIEFPTIDGCPKRHYELRMPVTCGIHGSQLLQTYFKFAVFH